MRLELHVIELELHVMQLELHVMGLELHVIELELHVMRLMLHVLRLMLHVLRLMLHVIELEHHVMRLMLHVIELELHVMELELHVMGLEQLMVPADLFALDAQSTELHNQHDAAGVELWDCVTRVRTGVKSVFGGTRLGDRKPGKKKGELPDTPNPHPCKKGESVCLCPFFTVVTNIHR